MTTAPAGPGAGPATTRVPTLLVAAVATALLVAFMVVSAALTVAAHSAPLTWGIAGVLVLWGLVLGWAASGIGRARPWARGPVVAAGLLHAASFGSFVPTQPLALIPAALGLAAAVAAVLPASTRALRPAGLDAAEQQDGDPTL